MTKIKQKKYKNNVSLKKRNIMVFTQTEGSAAVSFAENTYSMLRQILVDKFHFDTTDKCDLKNIAQKMSKKEAKNITLALEAHMTQYIFNTFGDDLVNSDFSAYYSTIYDSVARNPGRAFNKFEKVFKSMVADGKITL